VRDTVAAILAATAASTACSTAPAASTRRRCATSALKGWDAVVRNNLHGTFLFSREVYTQWMEGHGGSIVNMLADIWGGLPGMGPLRARRAAAC
jgi:citronellol/citronellal dehydrogenase